MNAPHQDLGAGEAFRAALPQSAGLWVWYTFLVLTVALVVAAC